MTDNMNVEITPEIQEKLDEWIARYQAVSLCTDRVDTDKAIEYAKKVQRWLSRPYKGTIVAPNPRIAWIIAEMLNDDSYNHDESIENNVSVFKANGRTFIWPYLDGHYSCRWVAWATFCRDVLKYEGFPDITEMVEQVQFGPIYPLENGWVVISDRPTAMNINERGLHKDLGPALSYNGGIEIFALNGVEVPKWIVMTPREKLNAKGFAKIENVEQRREFVRKITIDKLIDDLRPDELDHQDQYTLYMVDLGKNVGKWPYLRMWNSSERCWHIECVSRECKTVQDANNFRASRMPSLKGDWKPETLT